jgi:hypothetical protein
MNTLIDNTGLHSSFKGLKKLNNSDMDIKGLLQFCSQVIFSNKIFVDDAKEKTSVSDKTVEVLNYFKSIGVSNEIISISTLDRTEYIKLYKETSDEIADKLKFMFKPVKDQLKGLYPDGLSKNYLERCTKFILLANDKTSRQELEEVRGEYFTNNHGELTDFLVTISTKLRFEVNQMISRYPHMTLAEQNQLNVLIRFYINQSVAIKIKSIYCPSVARAELVRNGENYIIKKINNILDDTYKEIKNKFPEIPSISKYLITKSNGYTGELIELSLKLREKSKPLRDYLSKISENHYELTPDDKFEIDHKIKILYKELLKDYDRTTKLNNAVELSISSPYLFEIKGNAIKEWYISKKHKKKISLLTEISKENIYSDIELNPNELYNYFRK